MSAEEPETRMKLVLQLWESLEKSARADIHHYNALLAVRTDNEELISVEDTLTAIRSRKLEPNELTFKLLLENCCSVGDLDGVQKTLTAFRETGFVLDAEMYNLMILAHGFNKLVHFHCAKKIINQSSN